MGHCIGTVPGMLQKDVAELNAMLGCAQDGTGCRRLLTTHLWPCVSMGDGETVPQVMIGSLGRLVFWRDIPEVS